MSRTKSKRPAPSVRGGGKRVARKNSQEVSIGPQRLQKVLASAGIASRRQCEQLILDGRVEIDGEIVTALGTKVDAASQAIRVDGVTLAKPKRSYYLVNKPKGVQSIFLF